MCNLKKGILIMKNLSNIKSTLAVSMLLSASLFSAGSCIEEVLDSVEHGKKAGYSVSQNEVNFVREVVKDCKLADLHADLGARQRLFDAAQIRQSVVERAFNPRLQTTEKRRENLGEFVDTFQYIALQASQDCRAVELRANLDDLNYQIAKNESSLLDLSKAQSAAEKAKGELRSKSYRQVSGIRDVIKDSNEVCNETIEAFAHGVKKTQPICGVKVEVVTYPSLNSFMTEVNKEICKDKEYGNNSNLRTLQMLAADLHKTKCEFRETKKELQTLYGKTSEHTKILTNLTAEREALIKRLTKKVAEQTSDRLLKLHNANVIQHTSLTQNRKHELSSCEARQKTDTLRTNIAQSIADSKHDRTSILLVKTAREATRTAEIDVMTSGFTFDRESKANPNCAFQHARVDLKIAQIQDQIRKNKSAGMRSLQEDIAKLEAEVTQYEVSGKVSHCEAPAPQSLFARLCFWK